MSSKESQYLLGKLFLTLAKGERAVEISRQVLNDISDYNPYLLFQMLKPIEKPYLDACDLINYMCSKNENLSTLEANLIILFYDQKYKNVLCYNEFLRLIQSDNFCYKNKNFNNIKNNNENIEDNNIICINGKNLSFNLDYSFQKLLEKEIELVRGIIEILEEIKSCGCNIHDLFHVVKNYSCIVGDSIKMFMDKNNFSYLDSDIESIMKRMDINKDGKVDLCEFHALIGYPECNICCPIDDCQFCELTNCEDFSSKENPCFYQRELNNNWKSFEKRDNRYITNNRFNSPYRKFYYKKEFNNNKVTPTLSLRDSPKRKYCPKKNNSYYIERPQNISGVISPNELNRGTKVSDKLSIRDSSNRNHSPKKSNSYYIERPQSMREMISPDKDRRNIIVSENLSLRDSPKRKYSPKDLINTSFNLSRQQESSEYPILNHSSPNIPFCNICHFIPCKCCPSCHHWPCSCFIYQTPYNPDSQPRRSNLINNSNIQSLIPPTHPSLLRLNQNAFEQRQFDDFLLQLISCETELEQAKINLSKFQDFNADDCFRIFSHNLRANSLSSEDLECGLALLSLSPTGGDLHLLMNKYDPINNQKIPFDSFIDIVIPFDKKIRKKMKKRIPCNSFCPYRLAEVFSPDTICCLKDYFNLVITWERMLNSTRKGLTVMNVKLVEMFCMIDEEKKGYFEYEELRNYLRKKNLISDDGEGELLFLRLDKNRDGKVDFNELKRETYPIY